MEDARIDVPVLLDTDDQVEVRVTPDKMFVHFRYPKELQQYISSQNFHFRVNTSELRDTLSVKWKSDSKVLTEEDWVANVPQAGRIQLIKIGRQGSTVEIRMRWKAVPAVVKADVTGTDKLPEGFQLVSPIKIIPSDVWITGESEVLSSLPRDEVTSRIKLLTERIDVSSFQRSQLKTVPIKIPPGVDVVEPEGAQAEVSLELQEVQTIKVIRGVKLDFAAVAPETVELEYKEKTADVTVYGPHSALKQLKPENFDIKMIRPAEEVPGTTREVPLEAIINESVPAETKSALTIKSVEPRSLRVKYLSKALSSPTDR